LGYAPDHPDAAIAWQAVRKLLASQDRSGVRPALPVALGHQPQRAMPGERGIDGCRLRLAGFAQITD